MALTTNQHVLKWVDEMVALTKPDRVVWIDGSEEQLEALRHRRNGKAERGKAARLLPAPLRRQ